MPQWIRKDFEAPEFAQETIAWFHRIFPNEPSGPEGLRVLSRLNDGQASLLVQMPAPLGAEHADWMKGWTSANEEAADTSSWNVEI